MINIEKISKLLDKEFGSGAYRIIGWEDEYCIHDLTMHTKFSANLEDHIDNIKDLPYVIDAEDKDLQLRNCICENYGD
tara:strand:- start:191 stop:424 length:234 start_codon:yes stop_codon:yes gene_type:complete